MKKIICIAAAGLVCIFLALSCSLPSYDVVIKGGTIVDGSGKPGYQADLGIMDGRILAIGKIGASKAREVIEARGKYVVPLRGILSLLLANILVQANDSPEGLTWFPPTASSAERIFSSV